DLKSLRLVMLWLVSRSKSRTVYKPLPLGMGFMTIFRKGLCGFRRTRVTYLRANFWSKITPTIAT
ncbi:MAG: hypothetical protein MUE44_31785, partial [Oscillatoriaceae cyanobacterium Prado104]|nr:hypothetical protein [Oscillatoriaceae cyanobacterium Prado104]